jgi:hypothetical protein
LRVLLSGIAAAVSFTTPLYVVVSLPEHHKANSVADTVAFATVAFALLTVRGLVLQHPIHHPYRVIGSNKVAVLGFDPFLAAESSVFGYASFYLIQCRPRCGGIFKVCISLI